VLTKLEIRNFKVFSHTEIELGPVTVLCGPNNSGKTTALQAIAKWEPGRVEVLIGEGQTTQVLRNLCRQLWQRNCSPWVEQRLQL
jgi:predicted ATPase